MTNNTNGHNFWVELIGKLEGCKLFTGIILFIISIILYLSYQDINKFSLAELVLPVVIVIPIAVALIAILLPLVINEMERLRLSENDGERLKFRKRFLDYITSIAILLVPSLVLVMGYPFARVITFSIFRVLYFSLYYFIILFSLFLFALHLRYLRHFIK